MPCTYLKLRFATGNRNHTVSHKAVLSVRLNNAARGVKSHSGFESKRETRLKKKEKKKEKRENKETQGSSSASPSHIDESSTQQVMPMSSLLNDDQFSFPSIGFLRTSSLWNKFHLRGLDCGFQRNEVGTRVRRCSISFLPVILWTRCRQMSSIFWIFLKKLNFSIAWNSSEEFG